jgi:hypothetical protein
MYIMAYRAFEVWEFNSTKNLFKDNNISVEFSWGITLVFFNILR